MCLDVHGTMCVCAWKAGQIIVILSTYKGLMAWNTSLESRETENIVMNHQISDFSFHWWLSLACKRHKDRVCVCSLKLKPRKDWTAHTHFPLPASWTLTLALWLPCQADLWLVKNKGPFHTRVRVTPQTHTHTPSQTSTPPSSGQYAACWARRAFRLMHCSAARGRSQDARTHKVHLLTCWHT